MSLSEADFRRAIESVASAWVTSKNSRTSTEPSNEGFGWEKATVLREFGASYLRITRRLPYRLPQNETVETDESLRDEEEDAIDEEDPEALSAPLIRAIEPSKKAVAYDIIHSPSYQVPVLYLTFIDLATNKNLPLPSPDGIYSLLVPDGFKEPVREVGIVGALSMAEHPLLGSPALFVHPCRTQDAMAPLIENVEEKSQDCRAVEYLMIWTGMIGASVGLNVPTGVAQAIARGRDELDEI